jgi:putative FmdB family regulatory protein
MYGFVCAECNEEFEELVFSAIKINEVVCPRCGSHEVKKQLSRVAAPINTSSPAGLGSASCAPGGV